MITRGLFRRPAGIHGAWQIHQVPVRRSEMRMMGGVRVTDAQRTAVDLFLGIGCRGPKRPLDELHRLASAPSRRLQDWPARASSATSQYQATPLVAGAADVRLLRQREAVLERLMASGALSVDHLLEEILARLPAGGAQQRRRKAHIREVLAGCTR
ncbi:hypothetical protein GCM10009771_17320 [Nesterenkonia flava]